MSWRPDSQFTVWIHCALRQRDLSELITTASMDTDVRISSCQTSCKQRVRFCVCGDSPRFHQKCSFELNFHKCSRILQLFTPSLKKSAMSSLPPLTSSLRDSQPHKPLRRILTRRATRLSQFQTEYLHWKNSVRLEKVKKATNKMNSELELVLHFSAVTK